MKSVDELVDGARRAHAARAKRYCMVTATRGPSQRDLDTICEAAERIKGEMDIELCASLGLLNEAKAKRLAASGVDRFNHNLETSERYYEQIVSTHTWKDRLVTVQLAKAAQDLGLQWVGDSPAGMSQAKGSLVIAVADRHKADPNGKQINQIYKLVPK